MSKTLQYGLYELCKMRIEQDEEFRAQSARGDLSVVDDELFDEYRLWQLKKTVKLVKENSAFYGRLYAKYNVGAEDIGSLSDIQKLPFTTPKDLSGTSYSFLCTSQGEVEKPVTFFSSGSTGMKKRIFFSQRDIQKIFEFLPRGMNTVVDRDEGRCVVFLQNSQGRGIGGILAQSLIRFGMQAWAADLHDDPEELYELSVKNRANVWFGEAITIYRATRILAEKHDLSKLGMQCIFITMTNLPQSMIDYLAETWQCRVSTHYGLTESGWGLAVDCDVCSGYHYNEIDHIIEIVDPDTGAPLPYGEEGEVVLTNISRDCMPLVRYRTGDIAKLEKAVCGSHLDVLGHIVRRKEGAYVLRGHELFPALFDEVLFGTDGLLDYRIFTDGDKLTFEVETLDPERFDADDLHGRLAALEVMQGLPAPEITLLPCGALREHCFEKKRIMERTP